MGAHVDEDAVQRAPFDRVHDELDPSIAAALRLKAVDVAGRLVRPGCADRDLLPGRRVVDQLVVCVPEQALRVSVEPRAAVVDRPGEVVLHTHDLL